MTSCVFFFLTMWIKHHKNKLFLSISVKVLPELTLMLDIHYMVPVLPKTNQFASLVASQNIMWNRFKSSVTANALQYCPCPREAHASFNRRSTVFTRKTINGGNAEESCWSVSLRGKTQRMPSNLWTPPKLCEVKRGHEEAETPSASSCLFFTPALGPYTHSETSVYIITASLGAASSFPWQAKRKGDKKIQSFSQRSCWFFCTVASIRCPTNVQQAAWRSKSVHQIFLGLSLTQFPAHFMSLYTVVTELRKKRPLSPALMQSDSVWVVSRRKDRDWRVLSNHHPSSVCKVCQNKV